MILWTTSPALLQYITSSVFIIDLITAFERKEKKITRLVNVGDVKRSM